MSLTEHFRLIWRRRWVILALSAVIAGVVFARSYRLDDVYESSATLDVVPTTPTGGALTAEEVDIRTSRYAALSDSSEVLRDAIDASGLDISVATARERVSATAPSDRPAFVTLTAEGPTPTDARSLADGVADALRTTGAREGTTISVITGATTPSAPASPNPTRDALLAFLIALIVNSELFALIGFVSGRLTKGRESDEVGRLTGAPVLAAIPSKGEEETAAALRTLRAGVDLGRSDPPVRSVAIVGAEPASGASFVALGLAQATADLKRGVVLVDANLRRPTVAASLDISDAPGLVEIIDKGTVDWDELPQGDPHQPRFRVVPAGDAVYDSAGILGGGALRKTIDQFDDADQVVVDAPAINESIDALVIAAQCDAVLLVIDVKRTRRRVIEDAVVRINTANVQLLGTALNRTGPGRRARPNQNWRRRRPSRGR